MLAYSARNRSASIRILVVASPKARRIEVRFRIQRLTHTCASQHC